MMIDTPFEIPIDRTASGIECTSQAGTTRLVLHGEIDAALRDQASEAMVFVVVQNCPVVIDVSRVSFIDSSGLAFLVQLHRLCQESELVHELRDPDDNLLDLLDVLGMAGQFDITRTPAPETLRAGA